MKNKFIMAWSVICLGMVTVFAASGILYTNEQRAAVRARTAQQAVEDSSAREQRIRIENILNQVNRSVTILEQATGPEAQKQAAAATAQAIAELNMFNQHGHDEILAELRGGS